VTRSLPTILLWSLVALLRAIAQQSPEVGSVKLYRYGDLLREHNIDLTEPALVRALKNPDASVRYLAAMKLAEDKAVDATPAIEQALAAEGIPRDRVNIALALGLLGDQSGREELKKLCGDRNLVPEFRLYAVRYTFDLHFQDERCLAATEQIVESKDVTFSDRISALELLSRFQDLTAEQSQKILQLTLNCLADTEPTVRIAAGQTLASFGNGSAIPHLEGAIAREQDEGVRSVLKEQLKKLHVKAKSP
jgi:HEAT repeat protein